MIQFTTNKIPVNVKVALFNHYYIFIANQALYACETCSVPNAPDFSPAGICLACSYACHNDHSLIELYTKRNFRCDCGNSKFPKNNPCKLFPNKDLNDKNRYNQNYRYFIIAVSQALVHFFPPKKTFFGVLSVYFIAIYVSIFKLLQRSVLHMQSTLSRRGGSCS